ncbi:MAG: metal-binding protein [Pseudonocardiales bacterium]|nr:metal-binding protein [Pseudonocardiales bacterium]
MTSYRLVGADGLEYLSATPGVLGGNKTNRPPLYGRLDCSSALRAVAKGTYQRSRVFFASEADAISAGFRPCGNCLRDRYKAWKAAQEA